MNEEHSRPFTPVPDSLLPPLTASSPCFLSNHHLRTDTHRHTHARTHAHTQSHAQRTCINSKPAARTKQGFILLDVSLLPMFLHLYVCMCVCVSVRMLVFPLLSRLPTTSIPPSLFPSFSLPLSHWTFSLYPLWPVKDKHDLSSRSYPGPPNNC